ncbi:MAG: 5-(carboxyamino)imidazole ribonucleotide mutase [Actinomycetota bacterium]|nr:5-(carboxyamino)imidazole ribonucleotide mutase [Actinomycetota bacterium]
MKYKVLIVMGSDSDLPVMEACASTLAAFGVTSRVTIASAHRSPDLVEELVIQAEREGAQVIVAGAGAAAHLAGVIASKTILPVIGVPLEGSPLKGFDALLSTVQMPPGVPVATMAVGKAGAKNAAIFAVQILARSDKALDRKLRQHKKDIACEVRAKAGALATGPLKTGSKKS